MKKLFFPLPRAATSILIILLTGSVACIKDPNFPLGGYTQTNLVADVNGFGAAKIDPHLANAWGIAVAPTGPFWISANHAGVSTVYDKDGNTLLAPVTIPAHNGHSIGAPTGVVYNWTTNFVIPSSKSVSKFIFAGEDGTISAWAGGSSAILVADRFSHGTVYKGLALATDGSHNFIYATDFHNGKIDVYDENFNYVSNKPFYDPNIPQHFAPFNIRNVEGKLFVTYAKQKPPDFMDDEAGPGNGFVDVFNSDGSLLFRFASRGTLNSPWGIVRSVGGFAVTNSGIIPNAILIGNFGDGRINVYDAIGRFEGQLVNKGNPVTIEGLWALENNVPGTDPKQLFFTAGPNDEEHGLFGYLSRQ
ncbi:MAG: TIGR03118 family protein [Chitinophagaceae bacterium]